LPNTTHTYRCHLKKSGRTRLTNLNKKSSKEESLVVMPNKWSCVSMKPTRVHSITLKWLGRPQCDHEERNITLTFFTFTLYNFFISTPTLKTFWKRVRWLSNYMQTLEWYHFCGYGTHKPHHMPICRTCPHDKSMNSNPLRGGLHYGPWSRPT
jgi:hypothetical protein